MSRRRRQVEPYFKFWKREGDFYSCDPLELEAAMAEEGVPAGEVEKRMGHGYPLLAAALSGVRLNQYEVAHVEWGIRGDPWQAIE